MSKFKKGDRVLRVSGCHFSMKPGDYGIVEDFGLGGALVIRQEGATGTTPGHDESKFELVEERSAQKLFTTYDEMQEWMHRTITSCDWAITDEVTKPKKSIMSQISIVAKKLLDADTKTLIKAGFLTSDLEVTNKAKDELWGIQFQAHKSELVELAKEAIEAEKDQD